MRRLLEDLRDVAFLRPSFSNVTKPTTPLFEGIAEDMSDEEKDISKSTPGYQMPA